MGKLLKGPYTIEIDGKRLDDVTDFEYKDGKLRVTFLITDYAHSEELIMTKPVTRVKIFACDKDPKGALYIIHSSFRRPDTGYYGVRVYLQDLAVMVAELTFPVSRVKIGEL